jgi:tRNA G18 (ribose-2'-O)-methylase SpoU
MPLNKLDIQKKDKILLILGSEGKGVSRTISSLATHRVTIPPKLQMNLVGEHPFNMIDSLNVGVSAALLMYHIN